MKFRQKIASNDCVIEMDSHNTNQEVWYFDDWVYCSLFTMRCNAFNLIKILKICSDPELHPIARLTLADSALSWYPLDLHTLPFTQMQKVRGQKWRLGFGENLFGYLCDATMCWVWCFRMRIKFFVERRIGFMFDYPTGTYRNSNIII